MSKTEKNHLSHQPVLLQEVLRCLDPRVEESYLDVTAGYGGHAKAVLERTKAPGQAVLIDRDAEAVTHLNKTFARRGVKIRHSDFLRACRDLSASNVTFDMILADLGASSPHFDIPKRGFSFSKRGPLDMRMDRSQSLTAHEIVNSWDEDKISEILRRLGQEPKSNQIARRIVACRPIETTMQLAEAVGPRLRGHGKIHPATRTFQALRIAVNDELTQLELSLPIWASMLKPGGRLAIISFHSLEDRLVKRFLARITEKTYETQFRLITKKPITARSDEIVSNPRARSAKLRAAVKIKISPA